jgi:uncharacterized membrane protein YagU involved in acid resistance
MNSPVAHNESLVKEKLIRALVGGFVGTAIFTIMGKFLAPHVIGQPMDVAALMAPMLGGSHTLGVIAHFVIGTFVFPIAYLILGFRRLPGPAWLRGALFLIPVYLVAMVVMMPILGQGLFFGNLPKAMVALMGHVVFGLAMGAIIGKPANQ